MPKQPQFLPELKKAAKDAIDDAFFSCWDTLSKEIAEGLTIKCCCDIIEVYLTGCGDPIIEIPILKLIEEACIGEDDIEICEGIAGEFETIAKRLRKRAKNLRRKYA